MSNGLIFVRWKQESIAEMNLTTKKVQSQDEYTMMRLMGIMDGLIPDPKLMEDE